MTSLPEQFSAARQIQLDHGFQLMRSLSDQALDRTSRLLALQIDVSRTAVEQSSTALRQLLAARDPRDLLAMGSQSQEQLRTLFDFGRELLSIAATPYASPLRTYAVSAPAPVSAAASEPAPAPRTTDGGAAAAAEAFERIGSDTASVTASATATDSPARTGSAAPQAAPAQSTSDFVLPTEAATTPVTEVVTSAIAPDAEPLPLAKATVEALEVPLAPPHPIAASVPVEVAVEIELPKVAPVDAAPPPPQATTGPIETRGTKGRRKQT